MVREGGTDALLRYHSQWGYSMAGKEYPRLKEKSIKAKLGGFLGHWKFTEK